MCNFDNLRRVDKEVSDAIDLEINRQRNKIELIASENFVSKAVLEAMGSPLTNKYAEGYPSKRYYGGCEYVDIVETLQSTEPKRYLVPSTLMCSLTPEPRRPWRCSLLYWSLVIRYSV